MLRKTFNNDRKTVHDKIKYKQYRSKIPARQKTLEGKEQTEEVDHTQENTRNKHSQTSRPKGGVPTNNNKMMRISKYYSSIILNLYGLNSPRQRQRLKTEIRNRIPPSPSKKHTSPVRTRVKGWGKIFQTNEPKKQTSLVFLMSDI